MTLLEIVQEVCKRSGIGVPAAVASSGDDQTIQLMGLLNEILEDLEEKKAFTFTQAETVFESTGLVDQGIVENIAPGFVSFKTKLFNRTTGQKIEGPIDADVWQEMQIGLSSGVLPGFRVIGSHLYLSPAPALGHIIAFEYQSNVTVFEPDTGFYKRYFSKDTDTCLYPDQIMIQGLRWIWRREKGLRYAENFKTYENAVSKLSANDGAKRVISLDTGTTGVSQKIAVPQVNWSVR